MTAVAETWATGAVVVETVVLVVGTVVLVAEVDSVVVIVTVLPWNAPIICD